MGYWPKTKRTLIRWWNELPREVRELTSIAAFKKAIARILFPPQPPAHYAQGIRHFQVAHTRLRLGTHDLKDHLFKLGMAPSPLCVCGEPETLRHYFLECSMYEEARDELIGELRILGVDNPTVGELVCGAHYVSKESNGQLIYHVQHYMRRSGRFTPNRSQGHYTSGGD